MEPNDIADANELLDAFGVYGWVITRQTAFDLWTRYSATRSAQGLVINANTLGEFAGWLIAGGLTPPPECAE